MSTEKTLAQYSEKDKPWINHRKNSMLVQDIYDSSGIHSFQRYAERMSECSKTLIFGELKGDDNKIKLMNAHFCRVRTCPVCSWRRTLALLARFYQGFPTFAAENPNMMYIYAVLTVRNPEMQDLRSTLSDMTKAWAKMRKRKAFRFVKGWIRTTEITKGKDGNPHPHFNLLMVVDKNYFKSKEYLNKMQWVELWQSCAKLDYEPSVYVSKVRKRKGKEDGTASSAMDAAKEVFKYSVKEADLVDDAPFLLGLTKEIQGLRFFAAGGCFKDLLAVDEDGEGGDVTDDELLGKNEENHEKVTNFRLAFSWMQGNRDRWDYWFRKRFEVEPPPDSEEP